MPPLWLRSKVTRRQQAITRALPDALDLLTICVEAGLGFDAAMSKVHEKWDNDLALSFGRVLQEMQIGKTRREALRDVADRMEVPDVSSFVAAIIQADQLGVSIAKVLRIQSDQMRVKRRQRAQEKAQQAPVKMVIPLVLLVFPSIWIVLLGPAGIQLFEVFGLVPIEAHREDQTLDGLQGQLGQFFQAVHAFEQLLYGLRGGVVIGTGRENSGHQDLPGLLGLGLHQIDDGRLKVLHSLGQ